MRRLAGFVGAIAVALTSIVSAVVAPGHSQSISPFSLSALAQDVFHCSPRNLDCGFEAGYFTIIDPERRTWQRAGTTKPTLAQLVMAFGTPKGTDGDRIVLWKGLYAELAQPLYIAAPANAILLKADLRHLVPWSGFSAHNLYAQGE